MPGAVAATAGIIGTLCRLSIKFRHYPPGTGTSPPPRELLRLAESWRIESTRQKSAPRGVSHKGVTLVTEFCYTGSVLGEEKNMSTTTPTTPEIKNAPLTLTPSAVAKVKEIMAQQSPVPGGLRVGVVGGGCSGFSYSMQFENGAGAMDKTFEFGDLKVFIDVAHVPAGRHRRLRRDPGRRRFQVREPERKEHLRLRLVLQRLTRPEEPKATSKSYRRPISPDT